MQIVVLEGALNRPTHEREELAGGRSFPDCPPKSLHLTVKKVK